MLELLVLFFFPYCPEDRLSETRPLTPGYSECCDQGAAALGGHGDAEATPRGCHPVETVWRDDDWCDGKRMILEQASRTRMLCKSTPLPPHCVFDDAAHECGSEVLNGRVSRDGWLIREISSD